MNGEDPSVNAINECRTQSGRLSGKQSLHVDAEARDLRKIRSSCEVEDVDVLENFKAIEASEDEQTAVG